MNDTPELVAWVGEDQFGSGEVGIKAAQVRAGIIPVVAISSHLEKVTTEDLLSQFQYMADLWGKTIRLVRYVPVEELRKIEPRGHD